MINSSKIIIKKVLLITIASTLFYLISSKSFISDFIISNKIISIMGIMLSISIGIASNLILNLNKIEEEKIKEEVYTNGKLKIRRSVQLLFILFILYIILRAIYYNNFTGHIVNIASLTVFGCYLYTMYEIVMAICKVPSFIKEEG